MALFNWNFFCDYFPIFNILIVKILFILFIVYLNIFVFFIINLSFNLIYNKKKVNYFNF